MNNSRLLFFIILSSILIRIPFVFFSSAKAQETIGTHGGKVLSNGSTKAEVSIHSDSKKVKVYIQRDTPDKPKQVVLTLFDEKNRPFSFELKAAPSEDPHLSIFQGSLTTGSSTTPGSLPKGIFSVAPQMGIELSIPLSKGKSEILTSK